MPPAGAAAATLPPSEFARRWGGDLVPASEGAVADLNVLEASRRFLVEAGLPAEADWDLAFTLEAGLPALPDAVPAARPRVPPSYRRFRRIGANGPAHVCLDERGDGRIVWVGLEPWRQVPVRVVSSSVPQLAELLLLSRDFLGDRATLREAGAGAGQMAALVRRFAEDCRRADPAALADVESFFALVVEQIETGLL